LLGLLSNPDGGGSSFLLNVGGLHTGVHDITSQKIVLVEIWTVVDTLSSYETDMKCLSITVDVKLGASPYRETGNNNQASRTPIPFFFLEECLFIMVLQACVSKNRV
jgi:hypothetical protein